MNDSMHRIRRLVEAWYREHAWDVSAGPQTESADITVVIPTLGREVLRETLRSLRRGSVRPRQVVVVHQGTNAEVREWIDEFAGALRIDYVQSRQSGAAAGRNRGIERVESRFVGMTDDDCIVAPDWIERLSERLEAEPDRLITGRAEPVGDQNVVALSAEFDVQYRPRLRSDLLGGFNMAGAADVLERIGPFDEDPCVATAEDKEYAYRALRTGVPITYDPDVVVGHVAWRDAERRSDQYDSYARALAAFYGKYLRRGDLFMLVRISAHAVRSLRRWSSGVLHGDRDRALNGRAYTRWLLPGLLAGWRSQE